MRRARLALLGTLSVAACSPLDDGVLSNAFLMDEPPPAESRVVPPESDTGVPVIAWGATGARCDLDVVADTVTCTFEVLPALMPGDGGTRSYELSFILWPTPLPAGFDARNVERDPGGHDPNNPPPPMPPPLPRESLGPVVPDAFGKATRSASRLGYLSRVVGGELHLVVPHMDGTTARYLAIDGRTGNLPDSAGGATPAPPVVGGHEH